MLDNNNYNLIEELNKSLIDELNDNNNNKQNYTINNTLNISYLIHQNISLFNLINNKNIILDKIINTYIQNIQNYNPINWNIKNFNLNNTRNNSVLDKYSSDTNLSNMKITFGDLGLSHGVLYNKFFNIESLRYYLLITYVLDSSIDVIPFIRDQNNNLIYWITKNNNLIYKKIDGKRYTYILDIPSNLNFKLYLFNPKPIKGTSVTISQFNINKIEKFSNITVDTTI
jgi:hypothetical protein